ncbi:hypothetical protein [Fulvimarina manganoxydans]|uniref:hypothetical protein n=1 Tax=Fulvimarina manganoxydans TaxID=937218 RepID=UPI002355B6D6|nr:hypothetical protein [Fulvimarina manganoxydans]
MTTRTRTTPFRRPICRVSGALFAATATLLAGCGAVPGPTAPSPGGQTGLDLMERLTLNADRCWFRSGDPVFESYGLAPELSSFSGRPRFLIVPEGKPEERPLLVIEGRTGSSDVSIYGPLTGNPAGNKAAADIDRWRTGSDDCA